MTITRVIGKETGISLGALGILLGLVGAAYAHFEAVDRQLQMMIHQNAARIAVVEQWQADRDRMDAMLCERLTRIEQKLDRLAERQ